MECTTPKNNEGSEVSKVLIGLAGVHYVAAELCRRGLTVLLAPQQTKGFDLIAVKQELIPREVKSTQETNGSDLIAVGQELIPIEVKTTSGSEKKWAVEPGEIQTIAQFVVFVWLRDQSCAQKGTPTSAHAGSCQFDKSIGKNVDDYRDGWGDIARPCT